MTIWPLSALTPDSLVRCAQLARWAVQVAEAARRFPRLALGVQVCWENEGGLGWGGAKHWPIAHLNGGIPGANSIARVPLDGERKEGFSGCSAGKIWLWETSFRTHCLSGGCHSRWVLSKQREQGFEPENQQSLDNIVIGPCLFRRLKAESRAVTSAHSEPGQGCLWVVFYRFEACMWWIKQNHVNLSFLSSEGIMGANLRHFNGLTKVLQSHCSALLSQMWMRPLQPPHPKQRKQTSLIHNVNMQVYQVNFPPFSISSVDPSVLLLHSYNGAQFLFSSHAHFFFFLFTTYLFDVLNVLKSAQLFIYSDSTRATCLLLRKRISGKP